MAGPLRPQERFEPYLTSYPLPSGERYVLSKTWQDTTVPRAGCVRTLSLVIDAKDWSLAESLSPFIELLMIDRLPKREDATRQTVSMLSATPLPPAADFWAGELLEALFLEETRPIVVLDASAPDLIALRLLTALWPSMRRRFALSTFARSPRNVGGRDFDLVFAPKDAKSKFSDWGGRRIDGRSSEGARHRWTSVMVNRVFEQTRPKLLTESEIDLMGGNNGNDGSAVLRIALLWDELIAKLDRAPTAALGLLDIANSGKVREMQAISLLEPALAHAITRATADLPDAESWTFLGAIAAKMRRHPMPFGRSAMAMAAEVLAARAPEGAVPLLSRPELEEVLTDVFPRIAHGLGEAPDGRCERALFLASSKLLLRLAAANRELSKRAAADGNLVERIGEALRDAEPTLVDAVGTNLLPYLVEDWHFTAAVPILARLDGDGLAAEISHLGIVNDFGASRIVDIVVEYARAIGAKKEVRESIVSLPPSPSRDSVLTKVLDSTEADVMWLLTTPRLSTKAVNGLLDMLLRGADDLQLSAVLGTPSVAAKVMARIPDEATIHLTRVILAGELPIDAFVHHVGLVLPRADAAMKFRIAEKTLQRCLPIHFDGNEVGILTKALDIIGERLNGPWVVRTGLDRTVSASVACRNMTMFRSAPEPVRLRIVYSIVELAQAICRRRPFDLDAAASEACAHLMFEAEKVTPRELLSAAGLILPVLMRHRHKPVSLMVAATFPMVYRDLAKKDTVPDILQFLPFFDWDRCKAARHELVGAFMSSSWSPVDLALTACRCADVGKILRRTAKSYGGEIYIEKISKETALLPDKCRAEVDLAISTIMSAPPVNHT